MIDGDEAGQRFSLVEHPMPPWALAAPLHRHLREDEYSFVLEGSVGALLGDDVVIGKPGDLISLTRDLARGAGHERMNLHGELVDALCQIGVLCDQTDLRLG